MAQIDDDMKAVRSEVERIGGETRKTAEEALKQSKDTGVVTEEVKQKADKALVDLAEVRQALKDMEARQLDMEQKGFARKEASEPVKSFGEQVAASPELKDYIDKGASGSVRISVKNMITSGAGSGFDLIAPQREATIVGMPRRRVQIRQLLVQGRTTSNLVQYPKQITRTNNAAVVAEGALKPTSAYAWALADAPVRTIAHIVPITRQALDDAEQLRTEVDSELRFGLDMAEEAEILNGDGTGQHLNGLMTQATAFAAAFVVDESTNIDVLRLAILQLELAYVEFDGAVINPTDWARIELTKTTTGEYVFGNPNNLAGPALWGRPVVSTPAIGVDAFLVGAFQQAATIYDRMDAEVLFSSEDVDNFQKNMITARAEKRLALAVKRPFALVKGDFGNVA